jgi:hypothetical protein
MLEILDNIDIPVKSDIASEVLLAQKTLEIYTATENPDHTLQFWSDLFNKVGERSRFRSDNPNKCNDWTL